MAGIKRRCPEDGPPLRTSAYNVYLDEQICRYGVKREKAEAKWSKMSRGQKDVYRKRAKDLNEGIGKKISIPASLQKSYMDRLVENLMSRKYFAKTIVKDLIADAYMEAKLDTTVFCILSISHFFEDKHDIFPCELGIAKFSLKHGVIDSMGIQINPGKLPNGASDQALKHSEETHKFDLPRDKEDDYIEILLKIVQFLKPEFTTVPIFFTEGGFMEKFSNQKILINIQRSLKKIFEKAGEYSIAEDHLNVVPISFLLYYIHRYINIEKKEMGESVETELTNTTEAHEIFYSNENYEHSTDGCEYHNELDSKKFCSLSKVRCYGYKLAELCSQKHKYPLIEGQHYPHGYQIE